FAKLRGVKRWINDTKMSLRKIGEVQNFFGRYRRFPELAALLKWQGNEWKIERCERQAGNYLIQGSCADLFKIAMVRVADVLSQSRSVQVMPIHDELIFYIHKDEFDLIPKIKSEMERFDFRVPMTVDISVSQTNWADKVPLKSIT
ncbi:DNA polymerase, partial [Candidatus Bathyarchaeota archaeon]|nr:DNA polymerase [Candidatus Bathyarchaeota archaeon]